MQTQPYPEGGQGPAQKTRTSAPNSLLVADCGSVLTKVSLFGLVEGQYRLMARGEAPTTAMSPRTDITEGILQATQAIEFTTGRRLIEIGEILFPEQPNGDGVDLFVTVISAGDPLRLAVLGAVSPNLENLAAQAISGLYARAEAAPSPSYIAATTPIPTPALSGPTPPSAGWTVERVAQEWERQLQHIRELQPQAALIVGMADSPAGPTPLQEACQLLLKEVQDSSEQNHVLSGGSSQQNSPKHYSIVYAGAPQYVEAVRRMVQGIADVTRVDSLVSQAQLGPISTAIGALHEREVLQKLPGYERLQNWSSAPPVASATSLSSLVRFLAQHYAMNVTAVDVGGTTTTIMLAGEQGEFIPMVNTSVGIGSNMSSILQQVGWQRIARWLPFTVTEDELRQFTINRMQHPHAVPANTWELQVCQAFAREAIMLTLGMAQSNSTEWPDSDLILATGGVLAHAPRYGQVAIMLLDALQPRGVTSLVLDKTLLISQLGAVATIAPIAAVQINENDAVSHRLGTCVIPFGDLIPGETAVRVGVEYSNGRQLNIDVKAGSIEVIPLRGNEQALLTLYPSPTVDVGLGPGERARAAEEIDGGLIGLIIDARGRPLQLPTQDTERQALLQQWMQALDA